MRRSRVCCVFTHPADLSHTLPRATLEVDEVDGSRPGYGSGGMGNADHGNGTERRESWAALHVARGCPGAERSGRVRQPKSVRHPATARQAGASRSRLWSRQLRRPDHGWAECLPLRRSDGRNRRPPDPALGRVVSKTLPNADRAGQERMTASNPVAARIAWWSWRTLCRRNPIPRSHHEREERKDRVTKHESRK